MTVVIDSRVPYAFPEAQQPSSVACWSKCRMNQQDYDLADTLRSNGYADSADAVEQLTYRRNEQCVGATMVNGAVNCGLFKNETSSKGI